MEFAFLKCEQFTFILLSEAWLWCLENLCFILCCCGQLLLDYFSFYLHILVTYAYSHGFWLHGSLDYYFNLSSCWNKCFPSSHWNFFSVYLAQVTFGGDQANSAGPSYQKMPPTCERLSLIVSCVILMKIWNKQRTANSHVSDFIWHHSGSYNRSK